MASKVPDFVTPHEGEISESAFRLRIEAAPLEYRDRYWQCMPIQSVGY